MITGSPGLLSYLNTNTSIKMTNGCTLEYNMNDLITTKSIEVSAGAGYASKTINGYTYKPFEKIFPLTSIIDPRRPKVSGIQYMVDGDPSLQTEYNTDGTVKRAGTLKSNVGDYKTYSSEKSFPTRLYFSSAQAPYKYWVSRASNASKELSDCIITVTYPIDKKAACNKIVVKFETAHSIPTEWNLKVTNAAGVKSTIYSGTTCPADGVVNVYYNGLPTWTGVALDLDTTKSIDINKLELEIKKNSIAGAFVGVIELSARYVIDVTERTESFNISANSSDKVDGLVPVGDVTANSINLSLNAYDKNYDHYDKIKAFDKDKISLYKNIIIRPYVRVDMEIINLGVFYLDSYSVDEFGEINISGLDGARELQYIKPPDIVTKDMSSVAIIRRLLDSIGFTNYNFNIPEDSKDTVTPYYWYTDKEKTVWQLIQDLCKDTQTVAIFDENDKLQFYPRSYLFSPTKLPQASFRYDTKLTNLPNISSISIDHVPSVKSIKVLYSPQLSSSYLINADPLYKSPVVTLGASALTESVKADNKIIGLEADAPLGSLFLEPIAISGVEQQFYSYSGYLVVEKEIIEYDAIRYEYESTEPGTDSVPIWITSESDVQKYQGLGKPNTFKPTGEYRIKTRNAFNVIKLGEERALVHNVDTDALKAEWDGFKWDSVTGDFVPDSSDAVFTLKKIKVEKDASGNYKDNPNNLFASIPKSMMTIFAPEVQLKTNEDPATKISNPTIAVKNTSYRLITPKAPAEFLGTVTPTSNDSFAIGTNMYFPYRIDPVSKLPTGNQPTIAGIAFGLSADNKSGYLLTIGTSQNANIEKGYRDVNFYKIKNGIPEKLITSQKESDGTIITNINGGQLYKIDIKANWSIPENGTKKALALKISINNKVIGVIDTDATSVPEKVGLLSLQGISVFDYIYTTSITKEQFLSGEDYDLYRGLLGAGSSVIKTFGDFVFGEGVTATDSTSWLKEFGPVARELRRIKARFANPGFPQYTQLINNDTVTVVGSAFDTFTIDTFVMNNTGAFTSLSDGKTKDFIVVGDFIDNSNQFEYMKPGLTDEEKQDQVGFESTWIQKEDEAKELAEWMTDQWSMQQKVLTMQIFVNPILQVGDVIEVSYPSNHIYSSEDLTLPVGYKRSRFVILSLDSTYDNASPPTTTVVCRSIYVP